MTPTPARSCLTIKGTRYKRCRVWTQFMLSNKKARVWDVQGMQILHPDHTYQYKGQGMGCAEHADPAPRSCLLINRTGCR